MQPPEKNAAPSHAGNTASVLAEEASADPLTTLLSRAAESAPPRVRDWLVRLRDGDAQERQETK